MMASVDEGVGDVFKALEETGELDNTCILFLGDNGYFFGEHGLGPERRFAYEEGIARRSSCAIRRWFKPGTVTTIWCSRSTSRPTMIELAGGKPALTHPGPLAAAAAAKAGSARLADIVPVEYCNENAMPWIVGMSYKAVRTERPS